MLKFLPLLWSNLRRKPVRAGLTFASILVAFLLFGLLKTLEFALAFGADLAGADRLVTMHKMSLIQSFPHSYLGRIRAVDGVRSATAQSWFGGIYQDPRNAISAFTADPETFLEVYEEYAMPPEQRAAWFADRSSAIVGRNLAELYGWQVGDTVPIRSSFYTQPDGSSAWDMKIAAIYDASNGDNSSLYFHYDYLNEALSEEGGRDLIGWVILRVEDPERMEGIAREIDALFANSPAETKTSTERAWIQGFANQMGDIGAIVAAVATAVFFTMLLVTGNTMAQSVRERTNEIAVLKTLGFRSRGVSALVLAESFVITALGGAAGLGLAWLGADQMAAGLTQYFPVFGIPPSTYVEGAILIVVLSALAGMLPAREALKLKITEALRKA